MHMSSLKSFVISDKEDEENFDGVSDLALTLDRRDFSVDGYLVDSKKYPLIGKAFLRGKAKAALVEEEEEDTEDIVGVGGTPSSSTANLESDDLGVSMLDYVLFRVTKQFFRTK